MDSIADLLDGQLRTGLAQLVDPDASDAAPASSENAAETAQDRAHEAATEAVLDEADLDPIDVHGELTLRGDLDMNDVPPRAVAACAECEAEVAFSDSQIEQWVTLTDLLDAVSGVAPNH